MPQDAQPSGFPPRRARDQLAALDQIPTAGYPPAPPADPPPLSAAARMSSLAGAVADRGFLSDVARGLVDVANRGAAAAVGAPVDLAAAALRPLGYQHPAPVGGSEWIGQGLQAAGMVTPERRPAAEAMAALAVPGALAGGARGLSRLADMGPVVVPSAGRYGATAAEQLGAISPEGKARLLADLTAGKGSGTYRLGDVTEGQRKDLDALFGRATPTRDVIMTDDATSHLLKGRVRTDGFTPQEVANFAESALARRAQADLNVAKGNQHPSMTATSVDRATGRPFTARMPMQSTEQGYEVRTVVPEGLRSRKK